MEANLWLVSFISYSTCANHEKEAKLKANTQAPLDLSSSNAQFNYCAHPGPAVAFAVLFGITFCVHFLQIFTFHKRFAWVITMAAAWEFGSFICQSTSWEPISYSSSFMSWGHVSRVSSSYKDIRNRQANYHDLAGLIIASKNQLKSSTAVESSLLVLLAPLWVNAFVYMVFGRMVYFFLPEQKIVGIRAIHMAKWFVWLDIVYAASLLPHVFLSWDVLYFCCKRNGWYYLVRFSSKAREDRSHSQARQVLVPLGLASVSTQSALEYRKPSLFASFR